MKYASISIQLVSPRHLSFEMIIGIACLPISDEMRYCDHSPQPGFKCVLISVRLRSSNQNSSTAPAHLRIFLSLFFTLYLEEISQSSDIKH